METGLNRNSEARHDGLHGQFGVWDYCSRRVWSPCVGHKLGAASVLAAQGRSRGFGRTYQAVS